MLALSAGPRVAWAQTIGSLASERARLAEITGDTSRPIARDSLLASLVSKLPRVSWLDRIPLTVVGPDIRVAWNSEMPYSLNDGPLWAGRGSNFSITGGLSLHRPTRGARLHIVLAPTLAYSENRPFQIFPYTAADRSAYANPFHGSQSGASLDMPLRFGDRYLLRVDPGRTSLAVAWPDVVVGATTENEWWGPGIRNAIIMSDNAPGIPRFFARTAHPVRTRIGAFEVKLISGILTQSMFFSATANENRTLSGVLLQFVPRFDSTLVFGFERAVYAPVGPYASPFTAALARSFDALFRWENLAGAGNQRSDQIGAIFARWIFPQSGFEVYGEWARMALPESVTELLVAPYYSGGWTFGFQYAVPKGPRRWLRLQSELTYLEQSRVFPDRPTVDFYSGQGTLQGYTERGQIIGAAIGPGASSQWIALDWIVPGWQLGGFVGRIRWDNDAMYRQQDPTYFRHDVSVLAGLRAGWRSALSDLDLQVSAAKRFNYLFQNGTGRPGGFQTVDVTNINVGLVATPR